MAKKSFRHGVYIPDNVKKYIGSKKRCIFRSSWEYKFMRHLDGSAKVKGWCSECVIVPYLLNGKPHRYYPDFLVVYESGEKVLVEVKPFKQTKPPRKTKRKARKTLLYEQMTYHTNLAKWRAAQTYCKKRNWKFKIITEKDIFV